MTAGFTIQTILEIVATLFVVYGLLHEDKLVALENKVCRAIKNKFKK